jgi:hypothetical protein
MSDAEKAANLAAYKAKVAAKLEARKAKASSSAEVDELSGLLSRVSMSSSVDELESLLGNLSMGGRRRTRKQKHKGKKHPRKTRKTRRGGVQPPPAALHRLTYEDYVEEARILNDQYKALMNDPNSTAEEIARVRKESIKADDKVRFLKRGQEMR